jgi:hypothetical protein
MTLEFVLDVSFGNRECRKGIKEKPKEVSSTKPNATNDESSRRILNGCAQIYVKKM